VSGLGAKCPNAKIIATQVNNNDVNLAVSQVTDVLNSHPNLAGVFADNNTSGTGAARAYRPAVAVVMFRSLPSTPTRPR